MIDKSIFLDVSKILSYNCFLSILIGERGVGKTYGFKNYGISHFKKTKKKFVWLRRYATDLDEAIGTKKDLKFFKGIKDKYPNDDFDLEINEKTYNLIMNEKVIGYAMSLTSAESLKGTEYNDVDTIILDEFLVGDGGSRYLKNEVMYLLSIIESVARLRKIRVILLGNATSTVNPYFDYFNIHLPYNKEYQTFKNGTIVVGYVKNKAYREIKKQSEFGKLVAGTDYENYAIDNQMILDNNVFIAKKSKNSRLFCNLVINNKMYGAWMDNENIYISKKFNSNYGAIITFDFNSHNEKTILAKSRSVFMQNIIKHYEMSRLYFENQAIKHSILELLKRTRRY